jgi:uncharacterized membrane protein (UPF0136 family)
MWTTAILVWVYGVLVLAGGVMGFVKARSKPSLISGVVFGVLLVADGFWMFYEPYKGMMLALGLPAMLAAMMGVRWAVTRKFMSAGLMFVLSLLALVLIFLTRLLLKT